MSRHTFLAAASTLLAAPLVTGKLSAQERHVLTGSAVIWNLAGRVQLVAGSGTDVVVEVTRGGGEGSKLEVLADGNRFRVRYPDDDIVYRGGDAGTRSSTSLRIRDDGTFDGDSDGLRRRQRVSTHGSGTEAWADLRVLVPRNKRVEVHLALGSVSITDVEGDVQVDVHAASAIATGMKGTLNFDAGSGSIRVEGGSGSLDIETGSGSSRLSGFNGSRVTIEAGSGSVEARDVVAGRFSVDVGSGSVRLYGIRAEQLDIETGSGSVDVDVTGSPGSTTIDAGSGSVRLSLPSNANATLDINTGSGGIHTDFPVTLNDLRRRELRGNIGAGGPLIRVSTGSGGVRLIRR